MKTNINCTSLPCPEKDEKNCYSIHNRYFKNDRNLSECDYNLENFLSFLDVVKTETQKGDRRPIYVLDFFERLDEAFDITPLLEWLDSIERKVFIVVPSTYPVERFNHYKTLHIEKGEKEMNEKTTSKVFVGGDKTICHVTNEIAGWLDNCMDSDEEILISDENTLPLQAYLKAKNYRKVTVYHSEEGCKCNLGNWETKCVPDITYSDEKNIALAFDCDYGIFTFDPSDFAMRMAVYHLHGQGKATFVYRPELKKMKITRAKKPRNNI